jgi:hypothetical protein
VPRIAQQKSWSLSCRALLGWQINKSSFFSNAQNAQTAWNNRVAGVTSYVKLQSSLSEHVQHPALLKRGVSGYVRRRSRDAEEVPRER